MLKLHDELIEELAKSLMEQNYNPVVVTNHRLYARRFLDYLAERGMPVTMVTPAQVDQYFRHAVLCFVSALPIPSCRSGIICGSPVPR